MAVGRALCDHRWAGLLVADDPELESQIRERADDLASCELAEYAHGLGLHPLGCGERMDLLIMLVWPAGMDDDDDSLLVWDIGDGYEG